MVTNSISSNSFIHQAAHPYYMGMKVEHDSMLSMHNSLAMHCAIHPSLLAQAPVYRQLLCRYRSKNCTNLRARKRDGTLHRFCEEHRQRANDNQKRWASRRMQCATEIELEQLHRAYSGSVTKAYSTLSHPPQPPQSGVSSAELDRAGTSSFESLNESTDLLLPLPLFENDADMDLLWEALDLVDLLIGDESA